LIDQPGGQCGRGKSSSHRSRWWIIRLRSITSRSDPQTDAAPLPPLEQIKTALKMPAPILPKPKVEEDVTAPKIEVASKRPVIDIPPRRCRRHW